MVGAGVRVEGWAAVSAPVVTELVSVTDRLLTAGEVAELLALARRILTSVLTGQVELLEDLQSPRPRVTVSTARPR